MARHSPGIHVPDGIPARAATSYEQPPSFADTAPPRAIRVAIVDDHPIVRASLRWHLDAEAGIDVVASGSSGRDAIDLVRTREIDVLLLDIDMPRHSALDALTMIKAKTMNEALRVLIFSECPEHLFAVALLRNGADGYLKKSAEPGEITAAIRHVAQGRPWISPEVAQLLADHLQHPKGGEIHNQLSPRELQILLKLARGLSATEVASALSLSPKTVSTHRASLMRKLAARTASGLTYYALKHQLIE